MTICLFALAHSYVVAAALDGGTQVISFVLNFVSVYAGCRHALLMASASRPFSAPLGQHMVSQIGGAMVSIVNTNFLNIV